MCRSVVKPNETDTHKCLKALKDKNLKQQEIIKKRKQQQQKMPLWKDNNVDQLSHGKILASQDEIPYRTESILSILTMSAH